MRECQIKHDTSGPIDILRLDGALDSFSFPRLESSLAGLRGGGRYRMVLDCANLVYINSASLGALIGYARKAREMGGDLKLAALTPKIAGIVELLGFDKILDIAPDCDTALARFR